MQHNPLCPHAPLSDSIIVRNSMYPCAYCDIAERAVQLERERITQAVDALPKAVSLDGGKDVAVWKDDVLATINGSQR